MVLSKQTKLEKAALLKAASNAFKTVCLCLYMLGPSNSKPL